MHTILSCNLIYAPNIIEFTLGNGKDIIVTLKMGIKLLQIVHFMLQSAINQTPQINVLNHSTMI